MTHTAKPVRIADWNRMGTGMLLRKFGQPPARLLLEQRRVQVAAGAPFAVRDVFQAGCYQHQHGFPVGERADHADPAPYSLLSRPIALFVRMCCRCCLEQSDNCGMRLRWESVWSFDRGFPP